MTLVDWLVVLLVVVPAFPGLAAIILVRHWHGTDSPSLHERTLLAVRDWAVASIAAILALARMGFLSLPDGVPILMLAIAMLLVSLPSLYWLSLYWRGKFR